MEKIMSAVNKTMNSNTFINVILVGGFGGLSLRSMKQQNYMEALESEKDSLVKSNKSMKKTIWDWKQQLYAEAESVAGNALVPLSKLKAIYGEVTRPATVLSAAGGAQKGDAKLPAAKLVI